jgi:hypothetical protein
VRGVAYQVSGFFGGHASTLTATSHLDRHSCTITGKSSSQWQRSTARLRPLRKWLQGALLFRFLLQSHCLGQFPTRMDWRFLGRLGRSVDRRTETSRCAAWSPYRALWLCLSWSLLLSTPSYL